MKLILLFFLLIAYSIELTRVYKNSKTYLPTNSNSNYFYIVDAEYSYYSTYIYFCLEDNDFSLNYNSIKVCKTNTNPGTNEQSAINSCSSNYDYLTYYGSTTTSSKKKYYYKFYQSSFYDYSIVYYSGSHSYGDLYVTADDSNLLINDAAEALSTVAIVFIVIGSIIVIAVAIVISACCCACCACCRRSQPGIMPITQPAAYVAPNPVAYGPAIPLQASPVAYSPY